MNDFRGWFKEGLRQKAEYMIVVCDTYDHEDYPVYATAANFKEKHEEHDGKNMQRVMEVYNLSLPMEPQVNAFRVFNFPPGYSK